MKKAAIMIILCLCGVMSGQAQGLRIFRSATSAMRSISTNMAIRNISRITAASAGAHYSSAAFKNAGTRAGQYNSLLNTQLRKYKRTANYVMPVLLSRIMRIDSIRNSHSRVGGTIPAPSKVLTANPVWLHKQIVDEASRYSKSVLKRTKKQKARARKHQ